MTLLSILSKCKDIPTTDVKFYGYGSITIKVLSNTAQSYISLFKNKGKDQDFVCGLEYKDDKFYFVRNEEYPETFISSDDLNDDNVSIVLKYGRKLDTESILKILDMDLSILDSYITEILTNKPE